MPCYFNLARLIHRHRKTYGSSPHRFRLCSPCLRHSTSVLLYSCRPYSETLYQNISSYLHKHSEIRALVQTHFPYVVSKLRVLLENTHTGLNITSLIFNDNWTNLVNLWHNKCCSHIVWLKVINVDTKM